MTLEETSRVFERFYRAAAASGSARRGPAWACRSSSRSSTCTRRQSSVESEPGRGTHVQGPPARGRRRPESARLARRDPRPQRAGRRRRARDRRADRRAARAARRARHDRAHRRGGARAPCAASSFDAVTLDILMPGMDGFEVLRRSAQTPTCATTPIVFVSVFSGRQELPGEWVVAKPIDADELRNVLGAAVRAGRSRVLVVGRAELQSLRGAGARRPRHRAPVGARPVRPPHASARSAASRWRSSTSASATRKRSCRLWIFEAVDFGGR